MGKLDMKVLATQDKLSDDDLKSIQADVLAEEGIKPAEEKAPEKLEEEKEEGKEEEKAAEEKAAEEAATEKKKKEDDELLAAKEEDLSDEDKDRRAELLKVQEETKKQKEEADTKLKADVDKEVKDYAAEHKISEEEARTDFESREKILEKYKGDAKQLALANLHMQRLYVKTQEELKATKEAKPVIQAKELSIEACVKLIDDGKIKVNDKVATREQLIDMYRERYPDISENMEDDAVIKLVGKEIKDNYIKGLESQASEISAQSKEKRTTLLNSLAESDKKFIPEIQPLLEKYPDAAIMSENFKLDDLVLWAKGKSYDKDVKEFGEKEYKRGAEQAKIIAQKVDEPAGGGSQKVKSKSKAIKLTEQQKQDALRKYDGTTFTDDEKFEAYAEILEIDQKKP